MFFDNSLSVIGFYILDFCKICNQSISSISKKLQKNSIIPIGIQRDNQFHRIQNMDVLQKGDIVYFFCSEINLKQLRKILGYYKDEKIATEKAFISKTEGSVWNKLMRKEKSIAPESTININPNGLIKAKKFFI